jgi:GTP cyclohydrolase II
MDLGINVDERQALEVGKNNHNEDYLATKVSKLDHLIGQ